MDAVENQVPLADVTRSNLSDWAGAAVSVADSNVDAMRLGEDRVVADVMDYNKRAFDLLKEGYGADFLSYGPGGAPLSLYHVHKLFQVSPTLVRQFDFFEGVSWDSVQFRITTSNPKGLMGGFITGAFPFTIFNNSSFNSQQAYFDQNFMTRQHLTLSPHSELVGFCESKDVVFDVPWQHNVPYLPRQYFREMDDDDTVNQLMPGTPVIYFVNLSARYVSNQSYPAKIRVFVKFLNLRFYGPNFYPVPDPILAQGGEPGKEEEKVNVEEKIDNFRVLDLCDMLAILGYETNSGDENDVDEFYSEHEWCVYQEDDVQEIVPLCNAFTFRNANKLLREIMLKDPEGFLSGEIKMPEFGPDPIPDVQSQSGAETFATMALASLAEPITSAGSEILSSIVESVSPSKAISTNSSTYENPQAVQLAYVGDSAKVGDPPTTPIFRDWGPPTKTHAIMDWLRQPQLIKIVDTGFDNDFYANPTCPTKVEDLVGEDQMCTYFRFFSQAVSYWRGTIIFDFVVMGHPMVEVFYNLQVRYPPWSQSTTSDGFSENSIIKGVCSGMYRISVPMPFMTPLDHMSIVDHQPDGLEVLLQASTSIVSATFNVISTMLSAAPIVGIAVFMRAGEDFQFLQPFAVGLGYVDQLAPPAPLLLPIPKVESQVGLPPPAIVFETRAKAQLDTKQLVSFGHIEDFMQIWSRCLPFDSYDDNDEPIVEAKAGITPFWYPQIDTEASFTLNVQNSWWVTNDFVSFYSSMFLYYRGSIGVKILCIPGTGYKYFTITAGTQRRRPGHNPFTIDASELPPDANFGYGTVATDLGGQPVLEITVPLRSNIQWAYCNPQMLRNIQEGYYFTTAVSGSINTNVVLHEATGDLKDSMFRKIGADFSLAVRTLLPPPTLWMAKGNSWT